MLNDAVLSHHSERRERAATTAADLRLSMLAGSADDDHDGGQMTDEQVRDEASDAVSCSHAQTTMHTS